MRVFLILALLFCACQAFVAPIGRVAVRAPATSVNVVKVNVGEEEPIEEALRRFKRAVARSGHMQILRRRRTFESNGDKKKRTDEEAERRKRIMTLKAQRHKIYYK